MSRPDTVPASIRWSAPPDDVARALAAAAPRLGGYADLRYVPEIGSTNDAALELAAAGVPAGVSVLSDMQTAGRGRRGRTWCSPPEAGLYLSIVVRTDGWRSSVPLVTLGAGVAAADAVGVASGLRPELKWPNDLMVGRPWRKLGGSCASRRHRPETSARSSSVSASTSARRPTRRDRGARDVHRIRAGPCGGSGAPGRGNTRRAPGRRRSVAGRSPA